MVFASIYLAAHQRLENLLTLFNLLIWIFARLRAFSLMIILLTGILFACAFLNQVKTASSGPSLTRGRLNGFMCFKYYFLFAIHVEIVFVFTPYSSETLFFVLFPSSVFCKASYFSVIEMFTLLILLFMEHTNFFIINFLILIRSKFSEVSQERHCIVYITKKVFCWLCHDVWKGKWTWLKN